jgi:hypothetical protein
MVAYSFGGLVLKSLVVEMHKHAHQKPMTNLDVKTQNWCLKFLKNLKGVVFYSVPHAGGTQDLSNYFKWQCQQISEDTTPSSLLNYMESFNPTLEQLSIDFNKSVCEDINIYAFVEGLPIDNEFGILVPTASAIRLSNNNNYKVEDANHLTICKPPSKDLSNYFKWQCQQISEDTTPSSLLNYMESFNPTMEQLSIDFNKSVCEDINIYAFVEGLPIDNEFVRFSSKHINYPTRFHS